MSTWCSVLCNVDCIIWFYFHSVPYVKYFLQATWRQSFYFMRSNGSQNLKIKKKGFLHVPTEQRLLCCLRKSVCINHAMRPHWITLDCHKSSFSRKLFPKSVCYIWIGSAFSAESLALCEHVSKSSATVLSVLNALLSTPSLDICNWKIGNFMLCLILLHADGHSNTAEPLDYCLNNGSVLVCYWPNLKGLWNVFWQFYELYYLPEMQEC